MNGRESEVLLDGSANVPNVVSVFKDDNSISESKQFGENTSLKTEVQQRVAVSQPVADIAMKAVTSDTCSLDGSIPSIRPRHVRSFSDCTALNSSMTRKNEVNRSFEDQPAEGMRTSLQPRFLDDGGSSIVIAAGGHDYPKRQRGQSLVDYLMSNQSSRSCPELDRENAHFSVSEAMIAAIEETRFYEWRRRKEEEDDEQFIRSDANDESDEEIRQIKRDLQSKTYNYCSTLDGALSISPASSVCTITPPLSPTCSLTYVIAVDTTNDVDKDHSILDLQDSGVSFTSLRAVMEKERRKSRKLARLRRVHSRLKSRPISSSSGESTPVSATPISSTPINVSQSKSRDSNNRRALFRFPSAPSIAALPTPTVAVGSGNRLPSTNESIVSAESIALTLLGHFSQLRLPHESDMKWLVSEKDAPQHLLPMPQSWPVNPDEPFMQLKENDADEMQVTSLRGNLEWAPPRPQIVFAVYSSPNLKVVMAKQNYRCAGCGMKVEPEYSHSFRYCHYLGRYFCTACHSNKTSIIPSRIFKKWDFKKYLVSNFSFDLLERMWFDSLFRLGYINPLLYRRCKQLGKVLELRLQLVHVVEFLRICRFATKIWEEFKNQSADWLEDPEIYSLYDLTRVNSGELSPLLRAIVTRGMNHIIHCELCQARGFLCESCHASEVIFPFQVDNVVRCQKCGSCYHRPCWNSTSCPKCQRIARRLCENGEPKG